MDGSALTKYLEQLQADMKKPNLKVHFPSLADDSDSEEIEAVGKEKHKEQMVRQFCLG